MTDGRGESAGAPAADRHAAMLPYLRRMASSGEFPHLAPLLDAGLPKVGETFDQVLAWLLDGIAEAHRTPDTGD